MLFDFSSGLYSRTGSRVVTFIMPWAWKILSVFSCAKHLTFEYFHAGKWASEFVHMNVSASWFFCRAYWMHGLISCNSFLSCKMCVFVPPLQPHRYFLLCVNYFFYGETVTDYFFTLVQREEPLRILSKYHRFISFALYLTGTNTETRAEKMRKSFSHLIVLEMCHIIVPVGHNKHVFISSVHDTTTKH